MIEIIGRVRPSDTVSPKAFVFLPGDVAVIVQRLYTPTFCCSTVGRAPQSVVLVYDLQEPLRDTIRLKPPFSDEHSVFLLPAVEAGPYLADSVNMIQKARGGGQHRQDIRTLVRRLLHALILDWVATEIKHGPPQAKLESTRALVGVQLDAGLPADFVARTLTATADLDPLGEVASEVRAMQRRIQWARMQVAAPGTPSNAEQLLLALDREDDHEIIDALSFRLSDHVLQAAEPD